MKDKKALAIILAQKAKPKSMKPGMNPSDMDEDMAEGGDEGDEGKMAAAEEMMEALKSGDASRLLMAFEDLKAMCD